MIFRLMQQRQRCEQRNRAKTTVASNRPCSSAKNSRVKAAALGATQPGEDSPLQAQAVVRSPVCLLERVVGAHRPAAGALGDQQRAVRLGRATLRHGAEPRPGLRAHKLARAVCNTHRPTV